MSRALARFRALRGSVLWTQIVSTGVRLIDLPSRYAFHLIVAAQLGVAAAGGFYIAFSLMMLAASFGRVGIDRALTRAIARAIEREDPAAARAAVARAFALGAATVLPLTIGVIAGGALAGLHRLGLSLMVYSWLWPTLFCLGAVFVPLDIERALLLIAAATAVNAVIALILLHRCLPRADAPATAPPEPLLATGIALFSTEMVQLLLGYAPALVLGVVATDAAVGLYAVAWRIALAINLLVGTIAAISAPRFAQLYARGDRDALRRAAAQAIAFVIVLAVLPIAAMLAFPAPLLGLVGPGFEAAAPTLRILMIGQAVAVCCTAGSELLGMTNHAATLRRINLATLGVLAMSLAVFGSLWGSEGAALATSLTIAVGGVATALAIRRHLGFVPIAGFASLLRRA